VRGPPGSDPPRARPASATSSVLTPWCGGVIVFSGPLSLRFIVRVTRAPSPDGHEEGHMKSGLAASLALAALLATVVPGLAQAPRKDFIWARKAPSAPTLDGIMNEAAWAQADSMVIHMSQDSGIPGSGWFFEAGIAPSDPTNATLKFLSFGNQIYMGAWIRDKSIGGSNVFNRFDGLLMAIKDHSTSQRPAPPLEYFYSSWYPEDSLAAIQVGRMPNFRGRWTGCNDNPSNCTRARTAEEIANWDAATVVNGTTNTDATNDGGYTIEMRFNLDPIGYNI